MASIINEVVSSSQKSSTPILVEYGNIVYTQNGNEIVLSKLIGSGGEGKIFDIQSSETTFVAKIYHEYEMAAKREAKLKDMVNIEILMEGICWPTELLFDKEKRFIGCIMPKAVGKKINISLFKPMLIAKYHPNWRKHELVRIAIDVLKRINYLHSKGILICDINDQNILLDEDTLNVYFVDTDSYQVGKFPCTVGTELFTPPELLAESCPSAMRTLENEYYAVAVLLFMIMLVGKPPYSQTNSDNMRSNILNMAFPYPFHEKGSDGLPPGLWRYIWSHLPVNIKAAFFNTFYIDGTFARPEERLNCAKWLNLFQQYQNALDNGEIGSFDKMSEDILPTRFKRVRGREYVHCIACGNEVDKEYVHSGLCYNCRQIDNGEIVICSTPGCNEEILYSYTDRYVRGMPRPMFCPSCFEKQKQEQISIQIEKERIRQEQFRSERMKQAAEAQANEQRLNALYMGESFECIECGRRFFIPKRQHNKYRAGYIEMPRRCIDCQRADALIACKQNKNYGLKMILKILATLAALSPTLMILIVHASAITAIAAMILSTILIFMLAFAMALGNKYALFSFIKLNSKKKPSGVARDIVLLPIVAAIISIIIVGLVTFVASTIADIKVYLLLWIVITLASVILAVVKQKEH